MNIVNKVSQMSLKAKLAVLLGSIFVISTVFQLIFSPASLPFGPVAVGTMQKWESQFGKFSMDYPENWTAHELPQGNHGDEEMIAVIIPRNNSLPQVYISQKVFSSHEIDDVASWGEIRNQSQPGQRTFSSMMLEAIHTVTVTGKIREYTFFVDSLLGAEKMHCLDLYALNNELGYQFAFCSDEDNWAKMSPAFQQMIESVEFKPK